MPAIMDDPDTPTIYRVSGAPPYPDPANPVLPANVAPRQVTLRDRQTVATIIPFASRTHVPPSLLLYLSDQFRKEIEGGDTYPLIDPMPFEKFASYWFQNFGAIMLLGRIEHADEVVEGRDWSKECLGSFYIKPNYPGRSSHVCNAGFLVTDASRNRGVGRLMGETYLDWAPKLGYTYSVFNLVYETNVASCKIWDALGFKRIGRVKGCGNLKSYPGRLVDAIIYGRDLGQGGDSDDLVSDDRFDKIKYYLKYGEYPNGADRAEKSRLRSAATTYKLLDGDVLMLKDKEVVSNPERQFAISREIHMQQHAGINKTTATIAERYHWTRIKDTVSDVIRNCAHCKDSSKTNQQNVANPQNPSDSSSLSIASLNNAPSFSTPMPVSNTPPIHSPSSLVDVVSSTSTPMEQDSKPSDTHAHNRPPSPQPPPPPRPPPHPAFSVTPDSYKGIRGPVSAMSIGQILRAPTESPIPPHAALPGHNPMLQDQPRGGLHPVQHPSHHALDSMLPLPNPHSSAFQPIDPKIISQPSPPGHSHQLGQHQNQYAHHNQPMHSGMGAVAGAGSTSGHHSHHQLNQPSGHALGQHHNPHHHAGIVHNDPFASFHDADPHGAHHGLSHQHHHTTDAFTSLLNAPDDDDIVGSDGSGAGHGGAGGPGGGSGATGGSGISIHHQAHDQVGGHNAHSHAHGHTNPHSHDPHGHGQQQQQSAHHSHLGVHDARGIVGVDEEEAEREAAAYRDLDMLIEPQDDDDDDANLNLNSNLGGHAPPGHLGGMRSHSNSLGGDSHILNSLSNTSLNSANNGGNSGNAGGGNVGGGAGSSNTNMHHHLHEDMSSMMNHDMNDDSSMHHSMSMSLGGVGVGSHHESIIHDDIVDNIAGVVDDVNINDNHHHQSQHQQQQQQQQHHHMSHRNSSASHTTNPMSSVVSGNPGGGGGTDLRPGMDLEPDPEPSPDGTGDASINRFISKMDIGRLLSSAEEAARGEGNGPVDNAGGNGNGGDGVVDPNAVGGVNKLSDDDRLEDMQFGSVPG
ncbi:Protein spt10 [Sporothrix bragantina]|uniref:Protein spt10 n=1 Tax=Sporothrix bragantina TaxID=671064 RepID=A0ABP0AST0_9PEZI